MITRRDASGQVDGEIVVTYEDEDGNQTEKRTPVTVNVAAMDYGYDDMTSPRSRSCRARFRGLPGLGLYRDRRRGRGRDRGGDRDRAPAQEGEGGRR